MLAILLGVIGGLMAWGEKALEIIIKKVLLPLITTFAENEDPDAISDLVYKVAEDVLKNSIIAYKNMEVNNMDSLIIGFVMPTWLQQLRLVPTLLYHSSINTPQSSLPVSLIQNVFYLPHFLDIEYPISCCKMDDKFRLLDATCPRKFNAKNSYVDIPCAPEFRAKFFKYADYFAYGLIGIAGFLAALIAFTAMTMCVDCI
ncbi:hypothetical protein EG68_03359 [Paragonimus skrjabini miyazakii]|uniref:Uncharacterized protein n=1 Tax=Paragonimus skrjabini miyazakii TaxID=59628 RepID=A0A8S9Z721_9TREM|nr:hypothetical protein EG68_03359 [Paragonimus skrjabini miyazakii]